MVPNYVEGGWYENFGNTSNPLQILSFTKASEDFTFSLVFWALNLDSVEAEQILEHTVGVWREEHDVSVLGSLSDCFRRVGLAFSSDTRQSPISEPKSVRLSERMSHNSDMTHWYPFTEVAVCQNDTEEAVQVGRRLPGLSVRLTGIYELSAGRDLLLEDYAPVLTNPGLSRANTSGPLDGFTSLDFFDEDFMRLQRTCIGTSTPAARGVNRTVSSVARCTVRS